MTAFVLQEKENATVSSFSPYDLVQVNKALRVSQEFNKRVIAYANFLSLPLTLGMFVPVSTSGDVILLDDVSSRGNFSPDEIQSAQERVFFKGNVIASINEQGHLHLEIKDRGYDNQMSIRSGQVELLLDGFQGDIELTDSAIKLIYGNL